MSVAHRSSNMGRYQLGEKLGAGGMAEVFAAVDERGGQVAIKRILPGLARDAEFCEMFWDEARVMSRLEHPGVVRVLDYGAFEGQLFIALEFVDGPSLAKVLRKAAREKIIPEISAIVQIGSELLSAVDFVHHASDIEGRPLHIVHRDISPGNVMLTSRGDTKLGDFGIVRSAIVARRTMPGELKGKIGYMSPEQALGETLDPRSDLFSVGVILAEILMLRPLFLGKNEMETLSRTVTADLSTWHRFNQSVPLPLRAVVERALSRRNEDRFSSAREMRQAWLDAARAMKVSFDLNHVAGFLKRLELTSQESPDASGERPRLPKAEAAPSRPPEGSIPVRRSSSKEIPVVRFEPPAPPLGVPRAARRPVWSVEFNERSLPSQLFLALMRVKSGTIELGMEGRTLSLEVARGRIVAAHDSSGLAPLGRLLLEESILEKADLLRAIGESRREGLRLGEYLVLHRKIRESVLLRFLRIQLEARLGSWVGAATRGKLVASENSEPRLGEEIVTPESIAQSVHVFRKVLSPEAIARHLEPFLDAVVLPSAGQGDVTSLGLMPPEARALQTALEGGAYEGKTIRAVVEAVVGERLARTKEVEFALLAGLWSGLLYAPGFSRG